MDLTTCKKKQFQDGKIKLTLGLITHFSPPLTPEPLSQDILITLRGVLNRQGSRREDVDARFPVPLAARCHSSNT